MEVCVDSIESAISATRGGAARIELCSALSEGGLTPSLGTLIVVKKLVTIPIVCMIRPRCGFDFIYSQNEIDIMKNDIKLLKEKGADGFVFGCLTDNRLVDENTCRILLEYSAPLPVTFSRAFDLVADPFSCLETIIKLGFQRLLTSGTAESAEQGASLIKDLIKVAGNRLSIIPGGGINEFNLKTILEETNAIEFHGSAKTTVNQMGMFRTSFESYPGISRVSTTSRGVQPMRFVTDPENVRLLIKIYSSVMTNRNKRIT